MRLERWPRSTAVILGSAAYVFLRRDLVREFSVWEFLWRLGAAFMLTWTVSTANYVLNEIADLPFDIHHPTKRFRPLVRGEIRRGPFAFLGLMLIVVGLGVSLLVSSRGFFLALLALFLAGIVYNVRPIRTKDIPFLDAISESANNPIRFLIGWYAFAPSHDFPPPTLLLCWWSFGNFLMVAKRLSEFRFLGEKAADYRSSHKRYTRGSLLAGMIGSAAICLAAFLYFAAVFKLQTFFAIAPFILIFFLLVFQKTLREAEVMEEPEKLLISPKFALYTIFLLLLFILSFFKDSIGR
jgi:decaprenyl-phosphate phosphoribosyltransferase